MRIWNSDDYSLHLSAEPELNVAERVFDLVWRVDFTASGFAVIDIGAGVDSHTLRLWMFALKERLNEIKVGRGTGAYVYRSIARFYQQETTKFHLDGAPSESLLMLGYEPSKVVSRLFLAYSTRTTFDLSITTQQFLEDFNPMFKNGKELLESYDTELPQPLEGHSQILAINNSPLSFTDERKNPLGVMHKGHHRHAGRSGTKNRELHDVGRG